ncbi:winged helix-turn-helix domain-containing protein [Cytobacillus oceanisediminis]|uniref:OmpR/PhoB-type domain-containing protein n=1 Tax=Cytobacillus oceanisediminis 2691 TaxID=1196031 RepID=A0A160MGC6_9BACI|nr:winged helix-turn-helix domain-containing protein [Cytobacillus oceanisediminis]AND42377.1 hypothetical protein A361_25565 [Cytobacillus oceanisediminis 2691]MCM3245055.1 winged helix-turn-helix domain-containing protein [Cytobacillus oceanisediminis]MCS0827233.1 winged helix-turn-helix domain-containing protein [Cytobacillus firmus]
MDSRYIVTFSQNKSYSNLLELAFKQHRIQLLEVSDVTELLEFIEDDYCLAVLYDGYFKDSIQELLSMEIHKPIILFSSLLKSINQYLSFQDSIISISEPMLDAVKNFSKQEAADQYVLDKDVVFSIENHCINNKEEYFNLTNLEFRLLYTLLKNRGKFLSVDNLLSKLDLMTPSSLYVCIKKLREKIEKDSTNPSLLIYHKNKGYTLNILNIN